MVKAKVLEAFAKVSVTLLALLVPSFVADANNNSWYECHDANQVCCSSSCVLGSSCLGLSCSSDLDCLSGESCCINTCVNGSNCVGQTCSSHSDCASGESCCGRKYINGLRKCKSGDSCVGLSCSSDGDCAAGETCCGSECVSYHCSALVTSLAILVPAAGTILLSFLCVYLCTKWYEFCDWVDARWESARVLPLARQRESIAQGTSPGYSSPHLGRSFPSTTEQTDPGYTTSPCGQILLVQLSELLPPSASAQTEVTAQSDSPHLGQSPPPYDQSSPSHSPPAYEQITPTESSVPPPLDTLYDQSPPSQSDSPPPYEQILPIEGNQLLPPPPGVSVQTEIAGQSNSPFLGQSPPPPPYEQSPPIEPGEPPPPYSEVPEETLHESYMTYV